MIPGDRDDDNDGLTDDRDDDDKSGWHQRFRMMTMMTVMKQTVKRL